MDTYLKQDPGPPHPRGRIKLTGYFPDRKETERNERRNIIANFSGIHSVSISKFLVNLLTWPGCVTRPLEIHSNFVWVRRRRGCPSGRTIKTTTSPWFSFSSSINQQHQASKQAKTKNAIRTRSASIH